MARSEPLGTPLIYRVRAELEGVQPVIWRELLVYGELPLAGLSLVLQVAFGWDGEHPHEWSVGRRAIRMGARETFDDEELVTVAQALPRLGSTLGYRYDFGDDWRILVSVLERREMSPFDMLDGVALLLGAGRAAPPEDCGGVAAYLELLDASADPKHPRREEILEPWEGEPFDGEALDVEALDEAVARLGAPGPGEEDEEDEDEEEEAEEVDEVEGAPPAEGLPRMHKATARSIARGFPYDADTDAHLADWLEHGELDRADAVEAFHVLGDHPAGENPRLHAVAHVAVENQLAQDNPRATREAFDRLRAAGVSRHQAVHAVGSVVVDAIQTTLKTRRPVDLKDLEKLLRALRPRDWR